MSAGHGRLMGGGGDVSGGVASSGGESSKQRVRYLFVLLFVLHGSFVFKCYK